MNGVDFKLDGRFKHEIRGAFGRYQFDVGVLNDAPHMPPRPASAGFSVLAGGPVRRKRRAGSRLRLSVPTMVDVGQAIRARGINYLTRPFKNKKSRDILNFSRSFFKLCLGRGQRRQVENYVQAIIRNPITRGDYGRNTRATARVKGFNRLLIDTGQFFRSILATTRVRSVQK